MDAALAAVAGFFWATIAPIAIHSLLLLAAAGLLDRLLPQAVWPELRLAVGLALLCKLVLPPAIASPIPLLSALALPLPELLAAGTWMPVGDQARTPATVAAVIWLAGVLLSLLLLAGGALRLALLWRRALPAPVALSCALGRAAARIGIAAPPPLRLARGLESPCVFGLLRPRILLPAELDEGTAEHVLLHELAHVRRRDLPVAACVALVRGLYWFHPAVHLAARRLTALRELCCDRLVARRLGDETAAYRRTLLGFAAARYRRQLAATLPFAGRASLLERLRALERAERDHPGLRRAATSLAALLALGCAAPIAPQAEERAVAVAEMIARPPGCLQLRLLVMRRLAEEQRRARAMTPQTTQPNTTPEDR